MTGVDPISILLVDDTPQNLVTLEAILDEPGLRIVTARSAREALRWLLREEFAAILLDVNMPDMDGFEAASLIRQRPLSAHTPILFLTAYPDEAQHRRAYALGAVDFMPTPVDPVTLRAKVGVFADLHRNRLQVRRQAEQLREAEERLRHQAEHALRESEDRFRVLCTSAPVAILQLDAEGRCVYVSPLWEPTTGQTPGDAQGFGWAEAVHPGAGSALVDAWRRAAETVSEWRYEGAIEVRGRPPRWIDVKTSPILPAQGVTGYVGIVEDVTARKQTEEQLRAVDRRKDEFLAMLAHELRNPLAAIGNAVLVAQAPALAGRWSWSLDVIARQVRQLSKLIDDLTDASRVRLGRIDLRRERLELGQVLRRAIDAVAPATDTRRQRVLFEDATAPLWIVADATRLEQVFVNLLSNASKYSPDESGIQVQVAPDTERHRVSVSVRDPGIGLDPEMLHRIFDLFVQGQTSLDRPHGGLGIGLSLARRLTELHGGTVSARSDGPGRGSEFEVVLPLAPAERSAGENPQQPSARAAPGAGGATVLVVDDNQDAARSLALLLESAGFRAFVAHDGPAAVARVADVRPHAVLMDLGLPGLDGFEVAARLRASPGGADLILVAVSGYGPEHSGARSGASGFDRHLVKPVEYGALIDLLHTALGRRRANPEAQPL